MKYLIVFDPANPARNYDDLTYAVSSYASWTEINQYRWAVRTTQTASQIRSELEQYIDVDDLLLVCRFDSWSAANLNSKAFDWLAT